MAEGLLERRLTPRIQEALADTPVVLLNGPRQSGKTTMVTSFASHGLRLLSLDDAATLASARLDPTAWCAVWIAP
jgi:predicted AAA+ superfamily ATPase